MRTGLLNSRGGIVVYLIVLLGMSTAPAWGRWDVETLTLIDLSEDNALLEKDLNYFVSALRGGEARLDDIVFVMRRNLLQAKAQKRELESMPVVSDRRWRKDMTTLLSLSVAHHAATCRALEGRRSGNREAEEESWKTAHRIEEQWLQLRRFGGPWASSNTPSYGRLRRVSPANIRLALVGVSRVSPTLGFSGPFVAVGHDGVTLWLGPSSKNRNAPLSFYREEDGDGCRIDLVGPFGVSGSVAMITRVIRGYRGGPGGVSTIRWLRWTGRSFAAVHNAVLLESPAGSGRLVWADEWATKKRVPTSWRRYIMDRPGLYSFDRYYSDGAFLVTLVGKEGCRARAIVRPDNLGFRLVRWVIPWNMGAHPAK